MIKGEKILKRFLYTLAYLILVGFPALILMFFVRESLNLIALIIIILIVMIIGGIFDIWATQQHKKDKFWIWQYNKKSIIGFKLFGLPIEDIALFFVLTPLFIITLWESITKLLINNKNLPILLIFIEVIMLTISYFLIYHHAKNSRW